MTSPTAIVSLIGRLLSGSEGVVQFDVCHSNYALRVNFPTINAAESWMQRHVNLVALGYAVRRITVYTPEKILLLEAADALLQAIESQHPQFSPTTLEGLRVVINQRLMENR